MKRILCVLVLLFNLTAAFGQTAPKAQPDSGFMSWVHDAWKTVQDQGRAAAENVVRESQKRFRDIKSTVTNTVKKVHDSIDAANLQQKRDLLVELWRVRRSLDLLTLLRPETLEAMTGLDTSGLRNLEIQATSTWQMVANRIHGK